MEYTETYEGLRVEKQGHKVLIIFDNPATLNALSYGTFRSINRLFDQMRGDRDVWGVLLTGAGRSFIAGADLKDAPVFHYFEGEACRDDRRCIHETYNKIAEFDCPTIAAINGYALGGGAELALCCDIRICSETAKIGFPEVRIGGIPGYTGPSRAVKILGPAVAKEMIFTGRHYTAAQAKDRGFVTEVLSPDKLMDRANEIKEGHDAFLKKRPPHFINN